MHGTFFESEDSGTFDGCKIELQDKITKAIYRFFEPFRARLASKLSKSAYTTPNF